MYAYNLCVVFMEHVRNGAFAQVMGEAFFSCCVNVCVTNPKRTCVPFHILILPPRTHARIDGIAIILFTPNHVGHVRYVCANGFQLNGLLWD